MKVLDPVCYTLRYILALICYPLCLAAYAMFAIVMIPIIGVYVVAVAGADAWQRTKKLLASIKRRFRI